MSKSLLVLCVGLTVSACSEKDARPAKEVVAQAKAAAVDAKQGAADVAAKADRAVTDAARAVQDGVATAAQTTRTSADNVAEGVRELGQGGVVTGRVASFSGARLSLRPDARGPDVLRVDDRTRYLLHGGTLGRAALPSGTRVKATYVVEAQVPIATEVEVLPR
jgi:hypothetical protein